MWLNPKKSRVYIIIWQSRKRLCYYNLNIFPFSIIFRSKKHVNVLFNIKNNPNDDCVWTKSVYIIHIKGPIEAIFGIECLNFFLKSIKNLSKINQLIKKLHYFVSKIKSLKILPDSYILEKYKKFGLKYLIKVLYCNIDTKFSLVASDLCPSKYFTYEIFSSTY